MAMSSQLNTFYRLTRVSRETITSLINYESLLINANKSLNLIGNSTIDQIWMRHFLDSYQVIDFIEKNDRSLVDLGSGAGFPGLVIAILEKDRKIFDLQRLLNTFFELILYTPRLSQDAHNH